MNPLRQKLSETLPVRILTSVSITVTCLILLFVLTFWGTIYQVEHGLYPAQERFFSSLIFFVFGFIPFPGAHLTMWILFINIVSVLLFRFSYQRSNIGILIIHFGILTLLVSAFLTFHFSKESDLTLAEGEGSNVSRAYHDWELAVWKQDGNNRDTVAYDSGKFTAGQILDFTPFGFQVFVKTYYPNSAVQTDSAKGVPAGQSAGAGSMSLMKLETMLDPVKNIPGGTFVLAQTGKLSGELELFGGIDEPTAFDVAGEAYFAMLRYKRFPMSFVLKLIDFRKELHPGTEVARSFESTVETQTPELTRQTVISMNNPLRYKGYTFYQASYAMDPRKGEVSTLAVVKNYGRVLPYVASIITFLGLLTHFILLFTVSVKEHNMKKA